MKTFFPKCAAFVFFIIVSLTLFPLLFSQSKVYAQSDSTSVIYPTVYCLGSCAVPTGSTNDTKVSTTLSPSVNTLPSTPSSQTVPSQSPTQNPCSGTQTANSLRIQSIKVHSHRNGEISNLFAQILKLLIVLLEQLLGETITPPSVSLTPTPESVSVTLSPTAASTISIQPCHVTPSPIQTPTVSIVSPTVTPETQPSGNLDSFFMPDFTGKPFCLFSHQVYTVSSTILTVSYPAGSDAQSSGAPYGGTQICLPFSKGSGTDATLSYWVRFPIGFQFVKGGKLPGLYGGIEPFSGGKNNPNGWSMRLMWRTNGAGEVYGYISTTNGYGDDWGEGNFTWLADGEWHQVIEQVHLNTPGNSDGWVKLTYNGKLVIDQTGIPVTTTDTKIGGLFFSSFYGGNDSTWAPTANEHIDFMGFSGTVQ